MGVDLQAAAKYGGGTEDNGAGDVVHCLEIGNEVGWDLVGKSDNVCKGICYGVAYPVSHVTLARAGVCKGEVALDFDNMDRTGKGRGAGGSPEVDVGGGKGACEDVGPATTDVR